jgi:hypothetical protein
LAISVATAAGAARCQSPDQSQLARFQDKVRLDLTGIPNYTCLETIERAHREAHARDFKPVDTIRLEVSSVAGKELFAWPGSRQFEDRQVTAFVDSGTIGAGMFAMFASNLFVHGAGTREYRGEENLDGRTAVRCDFHLTAQESGFLIATNASAVVAASGSFWFDPVSLDLIRLDVYADAIPYSLRLEQAVFRTLYARTQIGDSDALLPKRSEVTMALFSGEADRNAIEFSQCREYRSESTITFNAPSPSLPEVPKPQVRQVDLPAGLLVRVELETPIDSKTAAVGDPLHARVLRDVRYKGDLAVPQGAAITGHICRLGRSSTSAPFAVGIELSEIEWEGTRATFYAELVDLNLPRLARHYNQPLIDNEIPGAGIFYIDGARFRIPPGYHMLWRTLARPTVQQPR